MSKKPSNIANSSQNKQSSRYGKKEPTPKLEFMLCQVDPKTDRQEDMFNAFDNNNHIIGYGSAGSGKTFVAIYKALQKVLIDKSHDRIIIVRSALSINHQGHLPGTLEEKEAVFERPYKDIVNYLMDDDKAYDTLKENNAIVFMSTSYIRGLTWDYSIVIADEVQNMLWEEINTVATRKGTDTQIVFLGDHKQDDLTVSKRNQTSGISKLLQVAHICNGFSMICFTPEDIVRDPFVKYWILATEEVESISKK